VEAVIAI